MINQLQKNILRLALHAGELMMKNGAEIYRVEDTIARICKACKVPLVEVFAIPTGIFVSIDDGSPESGMATFIKRISSIGVDLDKISRINQFSREFATTDLSLERGIEILNEIEGRKPYHIFLRFLGVALVAASFCLIFDGSLQDVPCALFIGMASYGIGELLDVIDTNFFIKGFCCSAVAAFLALLLCGLNLGLTPGALIIGTMMIFVPGVAITNAIRDLLVGDMMAGITRLAEASMRAVALAAGAGVILKLWSVLGGASL